MFQTTNQLCVFLLSQNLACQFSMLKTLSGVLEVVLLLLRLRHHYLLQLGDSLAKVYQGLTGRNCQFFQVKTLPNELRTIRCG